MGLGEHTRRRLGAVLLGLGEHTCRRLGAVLLGLGEWIRSSAPGIRRMRK